MTRPPYSTDRTTVPAMEFEQKVLDTLIAGFVDRNVLSQRVAEAMARCTLNDLVRADLLDHPGRI